MNRKQINGRLKEAQGFATKVIGKILGNKSLERKGRIQQAAGKTEAGYGDLIDKVKENS